MPEQPSARIPHVPASASFGRLTAALLGSSRSPLVLAEIARLRPLIETHLDVIPLDLDARDAFHGVHADLSIVLGGDGSILRASHAMGYHQIPVLGVNLGKLGFLADFSPEDLLSVLPEVAAGRYRVVEHLMFECRLLRNGAVRNQVLGLNEAAVLCGAPFSILDVHLDVDGESVTTYSCDGLIVATPVGSTAHSLSAGGPILRKDLQAFVISPISPHTLTNRPVVDSADRVFELTVPQPNAGTTLVVDGQAVTPLEPGDRVRIERAQPKFKLVEVAGRSYYRTLREKLGWGGRVRKEA